MPDNIKETKYYHNKEDLEFHGSEEVKLLFKAANAAAVDGIGVKERDILNKVDELLKGVKLRFLGDENSLPDTIVIEDFLKKEVYTVNIEFERRAKEEGRTLANAFLKLSEKGLTTEEKKVLSKFDEILNDAKIIVEPKGDKATILVGGENYENSKGSYYQVKSIEETNKEMQQKYPDFFSASKPKTR